ncbi:UNVERIFIED_CONTAM: hypothetical protein GTU68_011083 [Idotea baltica]|nr:hypothetical protein [Idotea baltica]
MNNTTTSIDLIPIDKIEKAAQRLEGVIRKTPFQFNVGLSNKYQCDIFLKREDLQLVRSFKIRGAYNKMVGLPKDILNKGVVCASAGNHAQGVAFACKNLEVHGKIYMPNPTPKQKIKKVEQFGGDWIEVVLHGDNFDEAQAMAFAEAEETDKAFIHPFDDEEVIAGQGTIGAEIVEQSEKPLDYLLIAVGGGGLIAGVSSYMDQMSPHTKIIAVEAAGAAALSASWEAGKLVQLEELDTFADGIAVKKMGERNFKICQHTVHQILKVPEGKISTSILDLYNEEAIVAEPAGAVSVAGLDFIKEEIKNKRVGIIICGGNNDIDRTQEIQERSMLHEGLKHYFIIKFPQRAGALRDFLNVLGPNDDITYFQYTKKNNRQSGPAMVGIELTNSKDFDTLVQKMKQESITFRHLNNDRTLFETMV